MKKINLIFKLGDTQAITIPKLIFEEIIERLKNDDYIDSAGLLRKSLDFNIETFEYDKIE